MKARPILFSAPMVRALLAGKKTQTRRTLKPQPPTPEAFQGSDFGLDRAIADGVKMYSQNDYARLPKHPTDWGLLGSVGVARNAGFPMRYRCPYGQPGDLLWVRETLELGEAWQYRADCREILMDARDSRVPQMVGWAHHVERDVCVSIHMPRWASRLTLEITDVRVERLQDISEADAIAEGLIWRPALESWSAMDSLSWPTFTSPVRSYAGLWNHINGPDSWDANPWVWVVAFKVHLANVDQVLLALANREDPAR